MIDVKGVGTSSLQEKYDDVKANGILNFADALKEMVF